MRRKAGVTDIDLLPGLPVAIIRAAYASAPGNELESGKFNSPESSAALVANAFGLFLDRPGDLPPFPGGHDWGWPATSIRLETIVRFPWAGGRHPCLDVLVRTGTVLLGVESRRYEPYRPRGNVDLSDAYWRPVWGDRMGGYLKVRDGLRDGTIRFVHLDAVQLVKHAFGLRTAANKIPGLPAVRPVLIYLYAEPSHWPGGRAVPECHIAGHRAELAAFADLVSGDEVAFVSETYANLLRAWNASPDETVQAHVAALCLRFGI
jgi:hypothetical protein